MYITDVGEIIIIMINNPPEKFAEVEENFFLKSELNWCTWFAHVII